MTPHPYREALAAQDLDRLMSLCADEVTLHSPMVSGPGIKGRDNAAAILAFFLQHLAAAEYAHDLGDDQSHVLIADALVLDEPMKLATFLEFDSDGKISDIWLMARPLKALAKLVKALAGVLNASGSDGAFALYELSKPLATLAAATDRVTLRLLDKATSTT